MNVKRELDQKEIRSLSFDLLRKFDRICDENGIRYSLGMGTLLGAVRHRGFIPWDDDIDVILTRPEYQKLVRLPQERFPSGCRLICTETERLFSAPLAKLIDTSTVLEQTDHVEFVQLGVYIDLFVYDALPTDQSKWNRFFRRGDFLQRMWSASELKPSSKERNGIKRIYKWIAVKLRLARFFALRLRKYAQRVPFDQGTEVANLCFSTFPRNKFWFPREKVEHFRDVTFENEAFPAFEDTDLFLRKWYGDYWKLPPEEERKGHHKYCVYNK